MFLPNEEVYCPLYGEGVVKEVLDEFVKVLFNDGIEKLFTFEGRMCLDEKCKTFSAEKVLFKSKPIIYEFNCVRDIDGAKICDRDFFVGLDKNNNVVVAGFFDARNSSVFKNGARNRQPLIFDNLLLYKINDDRLKKISNSLDGSIQENTIPFLPKDIQSAVEEEKQEPKENKAKTRTDVIRVVADKGRIDVVKFAEFQKIKDNEIMIKLNGKQSLIDFTFPLDNKDEIGGVVKLDIKLLKDLIDNNSDILKAFEIVDTYKTINTTGERDGTVSRSFVNVSNEVVKLEKEKGTVVLKLRN